MIPCPSCKFVAGPAMHERPCVLCQAAEHSACQHSDDWWLCPDCDHPVDRRDREAGRFAVNSHRKSHGQHSVPRTSSRKPLGGSVGGGGSPGGGIGDAIGEIIDGLFGN